MDDGGRHINKSSKAIPEARWPLTLGVCWHDDYIHPV